MKNNGQIPWKSISAESIAIIISILLAFAIDAWWDERKERHFEQEALAGLEAEYQGHYESVDRQITQHRALMRAVANLMQACQSGSYPASDISLDDALYSLMVPSTTDLGSGVRDSLISGGRIEILSNRELRYALSEWDSVVDEVTDGQHFSLNLVRETFIPWLAGNGISSAHGMRDKDGHPWPVPTRPISMSGDMQDRLFSNEEFCILLDHRYSHMNHTLDEFENLLQAIVDVLALIRGPNGESANKAR
jgi:hypothetical protein